MANPQMHGAAVQRHQPTGLPEAENAPQTLCNADCVPDLIANLGDIHKHAGDVAAAATANSAWKPTARPPVRNSYPGVREKHGRTRRRSEKNTAGRGVAPNSRP
eukprot:10573301-Lingulodinium_polyedra.AAC.1